MWPELLIISIGVSLFFAFWNGFTDAANAISTIVATRVLIPIQAVVLSAIGNFVGMFMGTAVALTIWKGVIGTNFSPHLILAVIIGGLTWDVLTWYFALPVSESHVLVGGLIGAGIAASGLETVKVGGVINKVAIPMVVSPTLAFFFALFFAVGVMWSFRKTTATRINNYFRKLQIASSFFFSLTHGTNDAQKTMGIIVGLLAFYALVPAGSTEVPLWVILACHAAISLGTFFGGWRIVRTMAFRITRLRPYQGFSAETGGALILAGTALVGFPVSTTHVISGAIMGVGATKRLSAVRWGVARSIVMAWVLTIPMAAFFSFWIYHLLAFFL